MRLNFKNTKFLSSIAMGALLLNAGCASSSGVGVDQISLSSLPSASGLVAASSSTSSVVLNPAVVGTPPVVADLAAGDFYGDLFTRIAGGDSATRACATEANEFFGSQDGGVGGDTACWMSQSVGQAVGQIMQNAGSLCYMKNMPSADGVTITPALETPTSIFSQQSEDRLVRVNVSGMDEGSMTVFIKVLSSANAGANKYTANLWFCNGETVRGLETFTVDTASNTFTSTSVNQEEGGAFSSEVSAGIEIASNGDISFDLDETRTANVAFAGEFEGSPQTFKASIEIAANNIITAKEKNSGSWGGNENFTKAEISGSGIGSLKFLQGATRGFSQYGEGENDNHTYEGAVEWNTDVYRKAATTTLLDAISADYRDEDFYSAAASVDTSDLSGLDCVTEPDYTVEMDFSLPAVAAIQTECDSEHFQWTDLCNSGDVSTYRDHVFSSFGPGNADNACGS